MVTDKDEVTQLALAWLTLRRGRDALSEADCEQAYKALLGDAANDPVATTDVLWKCIGGLTFLVEASLGRTLSPVADRRVHR